MTIKLLVLAILATALLPADTEVVVLTNDEWVQVFFDTDRNTTTGYRYSRGEELLVNVNGQLRYTEEPPLNAAAWGRQFTICVPLDSPDGGVETYTAGTMRNDYLASWTSVNCGGPDIDRDGDVDLADFGLFQNSLTGPRE